MKWCCEGLKHLFEQRQEKGLFFFAEPPANTLDKVCFWLGMRSVSSEEIKQSSELSRINQVSILVSTRIPIKYCPNCGKKLDKTYHKTYKELIDQKLLDEFFY